MQTLKRRLDALEKRVDYKHAYILYLHQWRHYYRTGELDPAILAKMEPIWARNRAQVAAAMADFEPPDDEEKNANQPTDL